MVIVTKVHDCWAVSVMQNPFLCWVVISLSWMEELIEYMKEKIPHVYISITKSCVHILFRQRVWFVSLSKDFNA